MKASQKWLGILALIVGITLVPARSGVGHYFASGLIAGGLLTWIEGAIAAVVAAMSRYVDRTARLTAVTAWNELATLRDTKREEGGKF